MKHVLSTPEPATLFHSLVYMDEFEDITLEKSETQEQFLKFNTLSDNFNQNVTVEDVSPGHPQTHAVDPNKES